MTIKDGKLFNLIKLQAILFCLASSVFSLNDEITNILKLIALIIVNY